MRRRQHAVGRHAPHCCFGRRSWKQKVNASRISIWWLKFRCHHALGVGLFLARRSVARSLPTVWVRAKFALRRRCCSLRSPRPGRPNRSPTLRRYPVSSRSNGGRATRMPLPEANKRARPRWAFAAEHPPPHCIRHACRNRPHA